MRKQPTDPAALICSTVEAVLDRMLPARKDDVGESIGLREQWNTRHVRRIDGDMSDTIERFRTGRWAVNIRPPEEAEEKPIKAAKRVFRNLYGELPVLSFEIVEIDDRIRYRAVVFAREDAGNLVSRVMSLTECDAEIEERPDLPLEKDDFAAISRIKYAEDHLLPVRHPESKDFEEPFRGLLDTLSGEWDGQTTIQLVAEPISSRWTKRIARGIPIPLDRNKLLYGSGNREDRLSEMLLAAMITAGIAGWWHLDHGASTLLQGTADLRLLAIRAALLITISFVVGGLWTAATVGYGFLPERITAKRTADLIRSKPWTENKATKTERADTDIVGRQSDSPAYRISMRVITTSENRLKTKQYHGRVLRSLRNSWHNPSTGQQFDADPVGWPDERSFRKMMQKIAARKPDRNRRQRWSDKLLLRPRRTFPVVMSDHELASVMHWPDRSAGAASIIDFATSKTVDPDAKAEEYDRSEQTPTEPEPLLEPDQEPTGPTAPTEDIDLTEPDPEPTEPVEPIEEINND